MPDTTPRLLIPQPKADRSDPFQVAEDIRAAAARIDSIAAAAEQGTLGGRPAAGTARRLYFATDEGVFYYDTGAAWVAVGARPTVGVYRSAAFTMTNVFQLIPWDAERWERNVAPDAMHSTAVNPGRLVAPVAGVYIFTVNVSQDIVAGVARPTYLALALNGVSVGRAENVAAASAQPPNGAYSVGGTVQRYVSAGDYFEAYVASDANHAMSVGSAPGGGNYPSEAALTLISY